MKRIIVLFFLFLFTYAAHAQWIPVNTGDTLHLLQYKGAMGSMYAIKNAVKDTGSIPIAKRISGITVIDSPSSTIFCWFNHKWNAIGTGSPVSVNISNADLNSDTDHIWSLKKHTETLKGITGFDMLDTFGLVVFHVGGDHIYRLGSDLPYYEDDNAQFVNLGGSIIKLDNANNNIQMNKPTYFFTSIWHREDSFAVNVTLDWHRNTVRMDASIAVDTVFLPPLATTFNSLLKVGVEYTIVKIDVSANPVVILPDGLETIDGNPVFTLPVQYSSVTLKNMRTYWQITAQH